MPTGETDSAWADGSGFPGANWSSYADVDLLPTVLTFDETPLAEGAEQPIAAGYGGLAWDQVGIYNPDGTWGVRRQVRDESRLHRRGIDLRSGRLSVTGRLAGTDPG